MPLTVYGNEREEGYVVELDAFFSHTDHTTGILLCFGSPWPTKISFWTPDNDFLASHGAPFEETSSKASNTPCQVKHDPPCYSGLQRTMIKPWRYENALHRRFQGSNFHPPISVALWCEILVLWCSSVLCLIGPATTQIMRDECIRGK